MAIGEIHLFDVGTTFEVQLRQEDNTIYPLVGATTLEFHFQKPDGTIIIRSGNFVTDGSDGLVEYYTMNTDLDQIGWWRYQVYVVIGSVKKYSDVGKFRVFPNLPFNGQ